MINQEEHRSHWDELAEQLGLEPEKPSPVVREVPAAPNPPPRHYSEEEPILRTESPVDDETSFSRDMQGESEVAARAPEVAEESLPDREAESASVDEEADQSKESQGRGRRRRRRRSKPDGERAADESTEVAPTAAADDDEAPRGRSRRERGRRHADPEKPSSRRQEAVKDQEEAPPSNASPAEEDDDLDDLSNWQAPSWQELIASLYRPER
jgi:hypothetical protein